MYQEIRIIRETLYEEVWTHAMTTLAKQYGLSDVGLRKICKKMKIPLPPQGYHLSKFKGRRPPLPVYPDVLQEHTVRVPTTTRKNIELRDDFVPEIAFEKQPVNRITVSDKLVSPHPLVFLRAKALAKQKPDEYGRIHIVGKVSSDISVFPGSVDRALRLLDALIKALEKRTFNVFQLKDTDSIQIQIQGESIPIGIFERAEQRNHRPKPEDAKSRWFSIPKYDYFPTGELQIRTADYYPKVLFSETRKRRLEDNLNEVIIRFIKYALQMKQDRLEREKRQQEQLAKAERRRELFEAIRQEKNRVTGLEAEVENWQKAQRIREYIEAVKKNAVQKNSHMDSRTFDQWAAWAQQQADRIDPLADSPPSILDEEQKYSR